MGYVYLICDSEKELYKIGVTRVKNNKRIKKLQTGNPTELFVVCWYECKYPFRLETMLHSYYKTKNVLNEWFDLSIEDINNFQITCINLDRQIKLLQSNPFFNKNLK